VGTILFILKPIFPCTCGPVKFLATHQKRTSRCFSFSFKFYDSTLVFQFYFIVSFETFGYERYKNSILKHVFFGIESLVFFSIPFFSMKVTVPLNFRSHNFIPIPFISSAATYYFYWFQLSCCFAHLLGYVFQFHKFSCCCTYLL
jgi:hypothetical protein